MDIKRIKQLAGLTPLTEAFEDKEFERLPGLDDKDEDEGNDYGSDRTAGSGDEPDLDTVADDADTDEDDDMETPGDRARRIQGPGGSKNIAAAIAAMRASATGSEVPELGDDVASEAPSDDEEIPPTDGIEASADVPSEPDAGDEPAIGGDTSNALPDVGDGNVQAPPMSGSETATSSMARGDKVAKARDFITKFPQASRKEFITYCDGLGVGTNYANRLYYAVKKKMSEFFVVVNPANGKVLAEGGAYDTPLWTAFDKLGIFDPIIMTEFQAKKAAESLGRNGHKAIIQKMSINEDADETQKGAVNTLLGKRVKFQSKLTEHHGILDKIEGERAYFTDDEGNKWSAPVRNLKG